MKVAIVGGCKETECLAPFDDNSWDIWVHGNQFDRHENRRVTKIFEIHDDLSEHPLEYVGWIVSKNIPMIVGEKFPVTGEHISVFPFDEANALMGEHLTSTPAYMMALAILMGADEIAIYGIEMAVNDSEYFHQRPVMYAWIGYARGLGIKVTIPDESTLFVDKYVEGKKSHDFGKPPFTEIQFIEMAEIHKEKIEECQQIINNMQAKIQSHDGARQTCMQFSRIARAIESGTEVESLSQSTLIK